MISDVFRESSGHRGEGEVCGMAWVPSGVQMDVHEVTACKDPQSGEIEPRVVGDHCYSAPGGGERLRDGAATCFNVDADCLLRPYRGGVERLASAGCRRQGDDGLGGEFGEVDGFSGGPLMSAGQIRPHREHADFE